MSKILIGTCDIGNGHINRQKSVIRELMKYNTEIVLAVTEKSRPIFLQEFPTLQMVITKIPWIVCNESGVDYRSTLSIYQKDKFDFYENFLLFSQEVTELFSGKPNLVISDYEPTVAWYAYSVNCPLVCVEQQSKYIYLPEIPIPGYSKQEEVSRLNCFFPKVDLRIISSFFKLSLSPDNVVVIPPIVETKPRSPIPISSKKGIIYFSPYSQNSSKYNAILDMIQPLENFSFTVYSNIDFSSRSDAKNIVFHKIGPEFKQDIIDAEFIITSAGHQLISEALELEIPVFLFPLSTYEQHYNCLMVENNNLGMQCRTFSTTEFEIFYSRIPKFRADIQQYKRLNWNESWRNKLIQAIRKYVTL